MDVSSRKNEGDLIKQYLSSKSEQSQQEYMEEERDLYHMIHLNIVVSGDVQRVGFRDRVRRIARLHNITGQVRNCEGYDVEIVAEGLEQDLQNFTQAIKIDEDPIRVESLHITPGIYEGKWKYFEIVRGDPNEELGERFDAALIYLVRIDSNSRRTVELGEQMIQKQDVMIVKQDAMLEKQDAMLEKQDIMIQKQDVMIEKQDVMIEKQDVMIQKQDVMIEKQDAMNLKQDSVISLQKETIHEIKEMRQDLKDTLQTKYQFIEQQLLEIQTILKKAGMMS